MYLKKTRNPKGRIYLSIVEGRRDKQTGHAKTITIQKVGYLDELEKEYPNPIEHFTQIAAEMKQEKTAQRAAMTISIGSAERVEGNERKNFGYVALSAIYHELEI